MNDPAPVGDFLFLVILPCAGLVVLLVAIGAFLMWRRR